MSVDTIYTIAGLASTLYDNLPSCASARKAARSVLGGAMTREVPPEPLSEAVRKTIEWTRGYGHGMCAAHPHCAAPTPDGGFMLVGDCTNYYQDENEGDVGTGKHWPASLTRAILVTKTSHDGTEEWSYRHDHGVGRCYGKYGCALGDGTLLVCGSVSIVDPVATAAGFACVQRCVILRLSASGELLSETIFPLSSGNDEDIGRREGCMCVAAGEISEDHTGYTQCVYVTGYVRGECGYDFETNEYDDDPMFLITLGHTFIRKLVFRASCPHERPLEAGSLVVTPAIVGGDAHAGLAFRQGMRIRYDEARQQVVVLAAVTPHPELYEPHFGAVAVDAKDVRSVRWFQIYQADYAKADGSVEYHASHPYAMCLSHEGGGGYIFAGQSYHPERSEGRPIGRALKVDAADGSVLWEAAFAQRGLLLNTECYGVCSTPAGLLLTCGTGAHHDDACEAENVWRCLMVLLAEDSGSVLAVQPYTTNTPDGGGNNAGEYVLATPDGGAVVVIDSQSFGTPGTGGNFALMKLKPETLRDSHTALAAHRC